MNYRLLRHRLLEAVKSLDENNHISILHPQINYDADDGDIWVDWVYNGDFIRYKSDSIITLPYKTVVYNAIDSEGHIDYERGILSTLDTFAQY